VFVAHAAADGSACDHRDRRRLCGGLRALRDRSVRAAQAEVAQADINLQCTQVRSPVNGYVTNLLLRLGDYAHAGVTNISVIDADSYWIDGYFEETKMAHISVRRKAFQRPTCEGASQGESGARWL